MGEALMCLIGLHRWRWHGLRDNDLRYPDVHLSQCARCGTIKGGWRGVEYKAPAHD